MTMPLPPDFVSIAADMNGALGSAADHAPFLRRLIDRFPATVRLCAEAGPDAAIVVAREAALDNPDVGAGLRRERGAVALAVALGDLAGAPLEWVVSRLTRFADDALNRAIAAVVAARTPGEPPSGFVALALGKQGSRELNYSSDIDPILLFDPQRLPRLRREEPAEAAVRIARGLVTMLQEPTGDGYVLRVDLRLRPAAEATPLALPIEAAIAHYESSALPWERAAFIRARAAAGDIALGEEFLAHVAPFVWRRGLDFGALRELRLLSGRIRRHHAHAQSVGPGFDLKRGRGGIREIEFFAQIHQLVFGGRDPALRAPATLDALAALAHAGHVAAEDARELGSAYRMLRTFEHRLQMVDDRQTHALPRDPGGMARVAGLAGMSEDALLDGLRIVTERAGALYDALDPTQAEGVPAGSGELAAWLSERGFEDGAAAAARVEAWRDGRLRTTRSQAAREALDAVLPRLLESFAAADHPDVALRRFDDLVTRLTSALNLFRLLEARPQLLRLLTAILAHAPALASDLARRASLLDGLLDATAFDPPSNAADVAEGLRRPAAGYEQLLEGVRAGVGERRFALGTQLVAGTRDPLAIGRGYSSIAEGAIAVLGDATVAEFELRHGRVPGGELVMLALGRLGGGMLTHASDLDLVYLFTGDFAAESQGDRLLGATTYFNRLAQRVTAALSVATASGPLYEVDTRLRPSGAQGLLAVSLDSFDRYQRESAWTWEHMALTRARPVFGSSAARERTAAIVTSVLDRPRDAAALVSDAGRMRGEIARHKPPAGPWDVKLVDGGLVDAEFTVHLLQLANRIGIDPELDAAALAIERAGLLASGFADAVALLQRLLIVLRLVAPGGSEPAASSHPLVAHACGAGDWTTLCDRYAAARALVSGEWRRVAGLG